LPLEFVGDAIVLSGLTGTKLKCDVIGDYYRFWWGITSGGQSEEHRKPTAIVELNAATGEVHVKETGETVLGSAGHALDLKANTPHTDNLKVVLIEDNSECYAHLKRVIGRRWPSLSVTEIKNTFAPDSSSVYLLCHGFSEAVNVLDTLNLGNAIYFFDPLRSVPLMQIEQVARKRMGTFFRTGTEFIIFLFTTDWFLGRDDFAPLPCSSKGRDWTERERDTVSQADELFGGTYWRKDILKDLRVERKIQFMLKLYETTLHKWFRYVLPLPFSPKTGQMFHLILCSNFETGINATYSFYASKTGNPPFSPDNRRAFARFKGRHPRLFTNISGRKRPLQWLMLWKVIRYHEGGVCDIMCRDLVDLEPDEEERQRSLDWLSSEGYLEPWDIPNAWESSIRQFKLNWKTVSMRLGVRRPQPLIPLTPEQIEGDRSDAGE